MFETTTLLAADKLLVNFVMVAFWWSYVSAILPAS
jgi:hypothetical protein